MVEQERGAVDQRPGDVLGGREPPADGLLDAHLDILAEQGEPGIDRDRGVRLLERDPEGLERGVRRQRRLALGQRVGQLPQQRSTIRRVRSQAWMNSPGSSARITPRLPESRTGFTTTGKGISPATIAGSIVNE